MDFKEQLNGIQHIGIPTNDIVHVLPFWENGTDLSKVRCSCGKAQRTGMTCGMKMGLL